LQLVKIHAGQIQVAVEGSIASVTPTVCGLFRVAPPALTSEPMLASIRARSYATLGDRRIERCLVYCPDALGDHIWSRFPEYGAAVSEYCPQRVHVSSVLPPKTPVCFASVFTGAPPDRHAIRKPERPVLTCDTLFDALIRAGRRIAIVAVRASSIDLMFRNRTIDYFSEEYDKEVTVQALTLLRTDAHDLVVVYHQEYDDQLHQTRPFSDQCVQALRNHIASLQQLAAAARTAWANRKHAIVVAPDHGAHFDEAMGVGDHGLDIPEDMCVSHWYGIYDATRRP
jgi:hypothetical protein